MTPWDEIEALVDQDELLFLLMRDLSSAGLSFFVDRRVVDGREWAEMLAQVTALCMMPELSLEAKMELVATITTASWLLGYLTGISKRPETTIAVLRMKHGGGRGAGGN